MPAGACPSAFGCGFCFGSAGAAGGVHALHYAAHGFRRLHAYHHTYNVAGNTAGRAAAARCRSAAYFAKAFGIFLLHLRLYNVALVVSLGVHNFRRCMPAGAYFIGFGFRIYAANLSIVTLGVKLCLLFLQFNTALRLFYVRRYLLLPHLDICVRQLLPYALEVLIVLRQRDGGYIEIVQLKAVFFKAGGNAQAQSFAKFGCVCVYFKNIQLLFLYNAAQEGAYLHIHHAAERHLQRFYRPRSFAGKLRLIADKAARCANKLNYQLARIADHQIHFAACANVQRYLRDWVNEPYAGACAPFKVHLHCFVYEVYFRMERICPARGQGLHLVQQGQTLSFKYMLAGAEKVKRLAVEQEQRLLRFVHDKLGAVIEILYWVLPNKGRIVPFVFYNA